MSRGYRLGGVFSVRAAGVPFDRLDALGSPAVAAAARRVLAAELAVDQAAEAVISTARESFGTDQRGIRAALKRIVRHRKPVTDEQRATYPWLEPYNLAAREHASALAQLAEVIEHESLRVHVETRRNALAELPDFAVIESEAILDELESIAAAAPATAPLRSSDRETDRSLAMYLQRVCAKGDTVSRFGPSSWGRVVDGAGIRIEQASRIAVRCIEVERWAVTGVIEVMNADPEVRPEVCPRLHPDAILGGDSVIRMDRESGSGELVQVDAADLALARRCDGATPAHELGDLTRLAELGVVIWELEKFALDASPLSSLIADVTAWREGSARARWLPRLVRLRDLAATFADAANTAGRREVMAAVRRALSELGVADRKRGRTLYSAANPISENCFRGDRFELGSAAVDRLVTEAAPWFDLFHDAYALAATRAFERYRILVSAAPRRGGRLSYAALVAFARSRGVEIENDKILLEAGIETFAELRSALGAALADRADAPAWELTQADCHVLRRLHELPPVKEFTYPQADVQIAAASVDEVAAGRYLWVVAELHQAFTPLQHALYWSCPDKPELHEAMAAALEHQPYAVRGALTEQPVHNAAESVLWALPRATFVGVGRGKRAWPSVRRVDADVIVDEEARDVRLHHAGNDLGSLVRGFRTMMGMHPFFPFERAPHAPRLTLGRTVVQRRAWHVTSAELGEPRPVGLSTAFVIGIERLRRDRGVPRWVFARPSAGSLATTDLYARDKDMKPFYLDLESTLFLDILERRLRKYGELVFSEMLPAPDQLVWSAPAGRVVFELRTSIIPSGPGSSAART